MSKQVVNFYRHNELPRSATSITFEEIGVCRQEFMEECDINNLMERYDAYLADPMGSIRPAMYYDFVAHPRTLMDAMDIMKQGEEAFMRLPAKVRREFDNNAAMFVDYACDPQNLDQMREWGLAEPKAQPSSPAAAAPSAPAEGQGAAVEAVPASAPAPKAPAPKK